MLIRKTVHQKTVHRTVNLSLAILLVTLTSGSAADHLILDQDFNPEITASVPIFAGREAAQTFVVGQNGMLGRVDLYVYRNFGLIADLIVEIRTTISGSPSETGTEILATAVVSSEAVPINSFDGIISVDLQASVSAGDVLALVLRSPDSSVSSNYSWEGRSGNAYGPGSTFARLPAFGSPDWTIESSLDLGFRTYFMPSDLILSDVYNAQDYFPIQAGNQWTYLKNGSVDASETVLNGTVAVGGVDTVPVQNSNGITSYYTNDLNGLRLHRQLEPNIDFGDGIPRDFTADYIPPLKFAAFQTTIGDEISGAGSALVEVEGLGVFPLNYSFTSTIAALEDVSVPLASFHSLKVETTLNLQGSILGTAIDETEVDTNWLVKYLGPVKLVQELVGDSLDTFELVALTIDPDGDAINVTSDNCPTVSNQNQLDTDGGGLGDACDTDDDNDGIPDTADAFPRDPDESLDTDGDGIGNNTDLDDDNDGLSDESEIDSHGTNPLRRDTDGDGLADGEELELGLNPLDSTDCPEVLCPPSSSILKLIIQILRQEND